jgi:hypothetical protein
MGYRKNRNKDKLTKKEKLKMKHEIMLKMIEVRGPSASSQSILSEAKKYWRFIFRSQEEQQP